MAGRCVSPTCERGAAHRSADKPVPARRRTARAQRRSPGGTVRSCQPQRRGCYRGGRPSVDVVASAGFVSDQRGGSYAGRYEILRGRSAETEFHLRGCRRTEGGPRLACGCGHRTDPEGRLLGPLKATHYAAGGQPVVDRDRLRRRRGAVLTIRPIERPDGFGKTNFRATCPAGWTELYHNGQLLAFTSPIATVATNFWTCRCNMARTFETALRSAGQIRREIKRVVDGSTAATDLVLGRFRGECRSDRVRRAARAVPARLARDAGYRARADTRGHRWPPMLA